MAPLVRGASLFFDWIGNTVLVLDVHDRGFDSGFNMGTNAGKSAGQPVLHAHIHLIPRRDGGQENPQGGVRKIFSEKAHYRKTHYK